VTYAALLAAHIVVLGYWLGSELVINSTYRFICFRDDLPFASRDAMTDHLMNVDQHVRYALILQLTLGVMLMSQTGLAPTPLFWIAPLVAFGWLVLVEATHRLRKTALGGTLALIDRIIRMGVMAALLLLALFSGGDQPFWLRLKFAVFAGIILCGLAIRFQLIRHFHIWQAMAANGPTPDQNADIKRIYWRATSILLLLWLFILAATALAISKP
jgi:hypothetical protein